MGRGKIENNKDSEMSETTSYKIDSSKIWQTILSSAEKMQELQEWHEQDIRRYQKALVGNTLLVNDSDRDKVLWALHEKGLWLNSHNVIVKLDKKRR